jgi:hypothetical protein
VEHALLHREASADDAGQSSLGEAGGEHQPFSGASLAGGKQFSRTARFCTGTSKKELESRKTTLSFFRDNFGLGSPGAKWRLQAARDGAI